MVSQNFASWYPIAALLRQLSGLCLAAGSQRSAAGGYPSSCQNVNGRIVLSFFTAPGRVVRYVSDDSTI